MHEWLTLVGALAVALTSPANAAFTNNKVDVPQFLSLICKPPLIRKDLDPVISIQVTGQFDTDKTVRSLDVIHTLFSGKKVDRSEQYAQTFLGMNEDESYTWVGTRKGRPEFVMRGLLHYRSKWHYTETLLVNGRTDFVIDSVCDEALGD